MIESFHFFTKNYAICSSQLSLTRARPLAWWITKSSSRRSAWRNLCCHSWSTFWTQKLHRRSRTHYFRYLHWTRDSRFLTPYREQESHLSNSYSLFKWTTRNKKRGTKIRYYISCTINRLIYMTDRAPEIGEKKSPEKHQWGIISEVIRTWDFLPGKVLEDPVMRDKLHVLLEKAGRTSGPIRFSYDTWVIYVSFPDYGETVVLRGTPLWPVQPDYTWKWKNIEFNEQAELKIRNYLERKKIQWTIKTSLADLSSDYEASA